MNLHIRTEAADATALTAGPNTQCGVGWRVATMCGARGPGRGEGRGGEGRRDKGAETNIMGKHQQPPSLTCCNACCAGWAQWDLIEAGQGPYLMHRISPVRPILKQSVPHLDGYSWGKQNMHQCEHYQAWNGGTRRNTPGVWPGGGADVGSSPTRGKGRADNRQLQAAHKATCFNTSFS